MQIKFFSPLHAIIFHVNKLTVGVGIIFVQTFWKHKKMLKRKRKNNVSYAFNIKIELLFQFLWTFPSHRTIRFKKKNLYPTNSHSTFFFQVTSMAFIFIFHSCFLFIISIEKNTVIEWNEAVSYSIFLKVFLIWYCYAVGVISFFFL